MTELQTFEQELKSFVDAFSDYTRFEQREAPLLSSQEAMKVREGHKSLMINCLTSLVMTLGLVD